MGSLTQPCVPKQPATWVCRRGHFRLLHFCFIFWDFSKPFLPLQFLQTFTSITFRSQWRSLQRDAKLKRSTVIQMTQCFDSSMSCSSEILHTRSSSLTMFIFYFLLSKCLIVYYFQLKMYCFHFLSYFLFHFLSHFLSFFAFSFSFLFFISFFIIFHLCPACGESWKPVTWQAMDGPASVTSAPASFSMSLEVRNRSFCRIPKSWKLVYDLILQDLSV